MTLTAQHFLFMAGILLAGAVVLAILQQRRTPQSALAWLLFVALVPYVAVPMFFALGVRKTRRRGEKPGRPQVAVAPVPAAAAELMRFGARAPHAGNRITLHETPEVARRALHDVVEGAGSRLDIHLYLLADDASGRDFVAALTHRARQGVAVHLTLDRFGSLGAPLAELRRLTAAGGRLAFHAGLFHPGRAGHLNLRDHRKVVLADGARVWSGGRNVADVYLRQSPEAWVDLSFDAAGPVVADFAALIGAPSSGVDVAGEALLQLVPAGPDEAGDALHDGLVSAIHRADRRVWIATPYYVPTEQLSHALASAARRGVDLRLLIPARSNQWTTDLARGSYLRDLVEVGGRLGSQAEGMMHGKAGVIDDLAWVGSANIDIRSMLLNFELALMAHDAATVAQLAGWFEARWALARPGLAPTTAARRLVEAAVRLTAPML